MRVYICVCVCMCMCVYGGVYLSQTWVIVAGSGLVSWSHCCPLQAILCHAACQAGEVELLASFVHGHLYLLMKPIAPFPEKIF